VYLNPALYEIAADQLHSEQDKRYLKRKKGLSIRRIIFIIDFKVVLAD
jgi:hypothetical protein